MRKIFLFVSLFSILTSSAQQSGELDPNFGVAGFMIENDENLDSAGPLLVLPNDQIIMAGGHDNFTAIKLMADGTLDTTFGNEGKVIIGFEGYNAGVNDVAIQPDGKIIMAGNVFLVGGISLFGVVRLNADGSLDTTFNGTGKMVFDFNDTKNFLQAVAIQTDGKILVAGQSGEYSNADFAVARINTDGTLDSGFGINGKQEIAVQSDDRAKSMALQADGKIIIGGSSYAVGGSYCWFTAIRLTTTGDLDTTFSGDGKAVVKLATFGNDTVQDMALQTDGKIVMLADSYVTNSQDIGVVRFTTTGELDTSFSGDGKFSTAMINTSDYPNAVCIQPDGKILIAGSYYTTPERNMAVLRLTSTGELDTTFSGDGKANFVVPGDNGVSVGDMKLQSTGQILVSGSAQYDFMLARIFSGNELDVPQWNSTEVVLYPNPAKEIIHFNQEITFVSLYTIDGKKVMEQPISSQKLDVSSLSNGIYLMDIQTEAGKTTVQKLVIER